MKIADLKWPDVEALCKDTPVVIPIAAHEQHGRHLLLHTDEFGFKAQHNVITPHDFHATILHLLGLDHEQLTFYHNGIQRRLTDVHGHVIKEVLG